MASEHPFFSRFPDQIVPDSHHDLDWMPARVSSAGDYVGADVRISRQSRPIWTTDLTDCTATESIKDTLIAMIVRNKGVRPVLMRVSVFCELGTTVGQDYNGDNIVAPVVLGHTDQSRTVRLGKYLQEANREERSFYPITYPHWDYPDREGIGRTASGPIVYDPMPEVQLYADNVPLPRDQFTVDRSTGFATVSNNVLGSISATGGFYILMLMGKIPFNRKGGIYVIGDAQLREPLGGR